MTATERRRPRVCLLALSVIRDDPRLRKQGDMLSDHGVDVVAVGLTGGRRPLPAWPILAPPESPAAGFAARIAKLAARPGLYGGYLASKALQPASALSPAIAEAIYWRRPVFQALARAATGVDADLYVANDWNTLPLAARLAGHRPFIYDSHEYAAEELPESLYWRIFDRGLAVNIEKRYAHRAALVSTVSDGIAKGIGALYGLKETPMVVRNVPARARAGTPVSGKTGSMLTILYHGGITRHRRLDLVVESVRLWGPGRRLVLRGPIDADYLAELETIVAKHGLGDRVTIAPPVSPELLVEEAAAADAGFVALPSTSAENRLALPNKIFEYLQAGLAVLAPDLEEVGRVIRNTGAGFLFRDMEPQAIADAVNALEAVALDRAKAAARIAAQELVWEREAAAWTERVVALARDQAARRA